MITRMQALAAAASGKPVAMDNQPGNGVDFAAVLKNAVENVNTAQNSAQAKAQSFSTGASDTSLEDVIVSLQKANLSLQGMIAVRNRLVDAYKEVTNLQV
jgi:flagellar hook-basal body complex protein FliE